MYPRSCNTRKEDDKSILQPHRWLRIVSYRDGCVHLTYQLAYSALTLLPVLNPRYKLQYFKQAKWPEDWINTAKEITREEYKRTYAHRTDANSGECDDNGVVPDDNANVNVIADGDRSTTPEANKVRQQQYLPVIYELTNVIVVKYVR